MQDAPDDASASPVSPMHAAAAGAGADFGKADPSRAAGQHETETKDGKTDPGESGPKGGSPPPPSWCRRELDCTPKALLMQIVLPRRNISTRSLAKLLRLLGGHSDGCNTSIRPHKMWPTFRVRPGQEPRYGPDGHMFSRYWLSGMICFGLNHYIFYAYYPEKRGWMQFDDGVIRGPLYWREVERKCLDGRMVPTELLFQRRHELDPVGQVHYPLWRAYSMSDARREYARQLERMNSRRMYRPVRYSHTPWPKPRPVKPPSLPPATTG